MVLLMLRSVISPPWKFMISHNYVNFINYVNRMAIDARAPYENTNIINAS